MLRRDSRPVPVLALVLTCVTLGSTARAAESDYRSCSIGYVPREAKHATVLGTPSGAFVVRRASDDTEAFNGELVALGGDGIADFSALEEEGSYVLEVDSVGRSAAFAIGALAYVEPYRTAMLGFYAWRSGVDVSVAYEGQTWAQAAGHLEDAYLDLVGEPGTIKDGTGGWYDAGDYGKYVVNSAITMGLLLQAWEDFRPNLEPITLTIPETGGVLPDYLDELRFQLDWMLKMQFDDGSVSHKITPIDFPEFIQPIDDTAPRYFSPWGSAATAGFVATMAKAARVYREYDADYAVMLEAAAVKSFAFLGASPDNHAADLSGFEQAQYQTDDADDRVWAAAELWETTGDTGALTEFESRVRLLDDLVLADWDWGTQSNLGVFTYLRSERPGRDVGLVGDLEAALLAVADEHVALANSTYGRGIDAVYWGSNGTVARICATLRVAYELAPRDQYLAACADQIAHLFGRNEYGRSQVTGVGVAPPLHPHDRRSGSDGIELPYPGYLVGGASSPGNWLDEQASYQTNEIAINWQGALVYALAGFVTPPPAPVGSAGSSGVAGSGSGSSGAGAIAGAGTGAGDSSGGATWGGAPAASGGVDVVDSESGGSLDTPPTAGAGAPSAPRGADGAIGGVGGGASGPDPEGSGGGPLNPPSSISGGSPEAVGGAAGPEDSVLGGAANPQGSGSSDAGSNPAQARKDDQGCGCRVTNRGSDILGFFLGILALTALRYRRERAGSLPRRG